MSQMPVIQLDNLYKTYSGGFKALKNISLTINEGEIFALLGPNGAGKTTLINVICGIVDKTGGTILVNGFDSVIDFRKARAQIGLVPQELSTERFESVQATVTFSRGLFGKSPNNSYIREILETLSLWEKRDDILQTLSGGMKRRVAIAKALAHEPKILFLDEPTAGVDVELRQAMWNVVSRLRDEGVTIILTTHYIEEAEKMADRVGVINHGEIILVQEKNELMIELGKKQLIIELDQPLQEIPSNLKEYNLTYGSTNKELIYNYDTKSDGSRMSSLITKLSSSGLHFHDVSTKQSSLEEIFVGLVK